MLHDDRVGVEGGERGAVVVAPRAQHQPLGADHGAAGVVGHARHLRRLGPCTTSSWSPTGCRSTGGRRRRRVDVAPQPRRAGHRAGAGDAAPRRRLGRLVRSSRATRRSRSTPTACTCVPVAAVRRGGRRVLRGLLQRHPVAALPRRDRAAAVPPALVGRATATVNRPLRRGGRRQVGRARRRRSGCTTTSSSWCRRCSATLRPDLRIGFFNHIPFPPVRAVRPAAVAPRSSSRGCSARTCSASSAPPTPTTSCAPAGRPARPAAPAATPSPSPRPPVGRRTARSARARSRSPIDSAACEELARTPRGAGPGPARSAPTLGNPRRAPAGRRPARLHQGHPAPAQGATRSCSTRAGSVRRTPCSSRWRRRAGSGSRPTRRCARRSRRRSGRINGEHATLGTPAVHYLHHRYRARRWPRCTSPPTSCS